MRRASLELRRPLVVFDLETTGVDPRTDKIVEIACVVLHPDGRRTSRCWRVNPGRSIPPGATAVHGITDEDVAGAPPFAAIAAEVLAELEGRDLGGFNVERFDLPLLRRELAEAALELPATGAVVDSQQIYHRMERRDLTAALRFYCDREHEGAHGAEADAGAAADVLEAQLRRYPDLPRDPEGLQSFCRDARGDGIDPDGKLCWAEGRAVLAFGKHRGKSLQELVRTAPDYLEWMLGKDFAPETKAVIEAALAGRFPQRAGSEAASRPG